MLKKLFKPRFVKFDEKYTKLTAEEESIIEVISNDIRKEVLKPKVKTNCLTTVVRYILRAIVR